MVYDFANVFPGAFTRHCVFTGKFTQCQVRILSDLHCFAGRASVAVMVCRFTAVGNVCYPLTRKRALSGICALFQSVIRASAENGVSDVHKKLRGNGTVPTRSRVILRKDPLLL